MPVIEPLSQHVIPFQLVLFRIAGLFVFAPMLASTGVPVQARTLLAVALAVAVYPMVPTHAQSAPDLDLLQLVPMIASETLLGVSMGLIALLPLIGMQMGGQVAGHQMGLGLAQSFNPALDVDSDVTGQLLFFLGVTIFNRNENTFTFQKGPIFTNILLADELNRIPTDRGQHVEADDVEPEDTKDQRQ